ncbi:MAG: hypothetical protein M1833_001128 [Piccolia ochrophora]|nr:MAG: hypothetical protein M1833_001128 [Piccolia ochrophora]
MKLARTGHSNPLNFLIPSFSPRAPGAGPQRRVSTHHQRRYSSSSSSKPSSTPDRTRNITQQQDGHPNPRSRSESEAEKRSAARLSRRKSKDVTATSGKDRDVAFDNLPSVPSTRHLHPAEVAISAFFSLHRPISVNSSVPPLANSKSFDGIFSSRKGPAKSSQVISTLTSAIESVEAAQQQRQHPQRNHTDDTAGGDLHVAVSSASVSNNPTSENPRHLDGIPNGSSLQLPNQLSSKFKPFTPPPVPVPASDAADETTRDIEPPSATLRKTYSAVLTILESTHPNGSKTYTARTSPIADSESEVAGGYEQQVSTSKTSDEHPRTRFLNRMRLRQERWEEYMSTRDDSGEMWSISVKRQRRLKMKKHKYKKLMKRTRNLRRRLERK